MNTASAANYPTIYGWKKFEAITGISKQEALQHIECGCVNAVAYQNVIHIPQSEIKRMRWARAGGGLGWLRISWTDLEAVAGFPARRFQILIHEGFINALIEQDGIVRATGEFDRARWIFQTSPQPAEVPCER
jgi:hypothetical protein